MQLTLHPSWPSLIVGGARVRAGAGSLSVQSEAERVLVAIVKTTFQADDPTSTPVSEQVPIFVKDEPYSTTAAEPVRYEHDLAMFKPKADVIVLGAPAPPQPVGSGVPWTERVRVDGQEMTRTFTSTTGDPFTFGFTFGWQSREADPRRPLAGNCAAFEPVSMTLPVGFSNLFFNGGTYTGGSGPAFNHPTPGGVVDVESRVGGTARVRRLHLPSVAPTATVTYKGAPGAAGDASARVPMAIDTIVFHKDTGRFFVVWRGVWPLDAVAADRYLAVALS